jgi:hypothetical protein
MMLALDCTYWAVTWDRSLAWRDAVRRIGCIDDACLKVWLDGYHARAGGTSGALADPLGT